MELHEIRYFLAVCETLHFTRAAERCNVTQPALTRAIQKLEAEFGGLLFSRERGRVGLTELGRLVQPTLEEALARTQEARAQAERFLRLEAADLRLGVMCTIGPRRFAGCLARFHQLQPGVAVTLVEDVPQRLTEILLAGEADAAVMAQPEPFDERLRAEPLYEEAFVVACGTTHRFAPRQEVEMRELDGEAYLERINCEFDAPLSAALEERGANVVVAYRSMREDWIQTMVAAGLGICLAPQYSLTHPGVLGRPVRQPEVRRQVALVTVAGRRWSRPLASFVQQCRHYPWNNAA
jgi:DNA-binding transcriptional LysR family regulator